MGTYSQLAKAIRKAGKIISSPKEYAKDYNLDVVLGFATSDEAPERLAVTDDSGYRAIRIGDLRGNVSYDTEKLNNKLFHKGYVYLYSDDSTNGKFIVPCYPSAKALEKALEIIAKGEYSEDAMKHSALRELGFQIFPNDNDDFAETKKYLSAVVEKFAEAANATDISKIR